MNQEIGLRIQEVRKKKGLSRGDLADMICSLLGRQVK